MEATPCKGKPYELAKRLIGTWEEYSVKEQAETLEGTLESRLDLDGCVLTQRFKSVDGAFSFLSFGYVEPTSNNWYEMFVFNNGRVVHWRWREDGKEIILDRANDESEVRRRLRLTNFSDDLYDVIEEQMAQKGAGWDFVGLTRARRIK